MTSNELNWLKDTIRFIDQYRGSEDVRELVNSTYRYNNNSVFFYINNLIRFSPHYYDYYNKTFAKSLSYVSDKRTRAVIRDLPDKIELFLDRCVKDNQEYSKLISVAQGKINYPSYYSEDELKKLYKIDQSPQQRKVDLFDQFLAGTGAGSAGGAATSTRPLQLTQQTQQTQTQQQQPQQTPPQINIPRKIQFQPPTFVKNVASNAQIITKKVGSRAITGLGNMARTTVRGLLQGGGKITTRTVGAAIQAGIRGLIALGGSTGGAGWVLAGAALIVLAILIILPLIMNLEQTSATLHPEQQLSSTGYNYSSGDISQCTFYRGGDSNSSNPTGGLKFNISEWPTLINEVASKVGVPSAALAAIARVECPDCFATKDSSYITNDYDAHTNGLAYGIMQFYPPTFESTFNENKSEMQRLFGKTGIKTAIDPQNSKAPENILRIYSIKDSLITAAFKLKKDAGTPPPYNKPAVERIIKSYFTQCTYTQGGGTYNYCDDVYNGIQSCQTLLASAVGSTSPSAPQPPTDQEELRKAILAKFGIDFAANTFSYQTLRWSWEIFHKADYYAPNFFPLIHHAFTIVHIERASKVTKTFNGRGAIAVSLSTEGTENLYKQIIIHELGHIIHGPSGSPRDPRYDSGLLSAQAKEGLLTSYSAVNTDESFAELVSYYINRGTPEQPTMYQNLKWPKINPLESGNYPQHLQFTQSILGQPFSTPIASQPTSSGPLAIPASGQITLCFGDTSSPYSPSNSHKGIDFANSNGTPIKAAADGVVVSTPSDDRNGNYVVINHPQLGVQTQYLHMLPNFLVKSGDMVSKGQQIGQMDASGYVVGNPPDHLHFLVVKNGQIVDPSAADLLNFSCKIGLRF